MGAQGTAVLDFSASDDLAHTTVVITGQAGIVAGSLVEAWIRPVDTADHTADEHLVAPIKVLAANIVAGTGFTIHGFYAPDMRTPVDVAGAESFSRWPTAVPGPGTKGPQMNRLNENRTTGYLTYGQWAVAWVWN